jgi:heptosyltransferase III
MRILIVKLKHIGDTLLLTPTLAGITKAYPDAEVSVLLRRGTEQILSGCPYVQKIITCAEPEIYRRRNNWFSDWNLISKLRQSHFDYVFELGDGDRGRWLSLLSGAKIRCCNGWTFKSRPSLFWKSIFHEKAAFRWDYMHRVEKDYHTISSVLPLNMEIPNLSFSGDTEPSQVQLLGAYDVILHASSRWTKKLWPVSRWIEVGKALAGKGHRILVSCGPDLDECNLANEIMLGIGDQAQSTCGKLSWNELAYFMRRAKIFLGVDTAAMHLSAACGLKSVVLFGPSQVEAWHPWETYHHVVTAPGKQICCPLEGELDHSLGSDMQSITCSSVMKAIEETLRS